jgi:hypothetical protein
MIGQIHTAWAWASYSDSVDRSRFDLAYLRAGSLLVSDGPDAYIRELAAAGYGDSSGASPASRARAMCGEDLGLAAAYESVLRRPRTAAAHATLAESLLARSIFVDGGVALRVAATLDPARVADRLRLATLMLQQGAGEAARVEFRSVAARRDHPSLAAQARAALDQLDHNRR